MLGEHNYASYKIDKSLCKKKISTNHLRTGMYVVELDRPWVETPFLFQGFLISSPEEIEQLANHCEYVYIDSVQSRVLETVSTAEPQLRSKIYERTKVTYNEVRDVEQEFSRANHNFTSAMQSVDKVFGDLKVSNTLRVSKVKSAVKGCVESIVCNSGAMLWLTQIKNRDNYTAEHSLRVAVMAIALGKELGLQERELEELGLAALLHDVGKLKIPLSILNKEGELTSAEYAVIKSHTMEGRKMLRSTEGIPESVISVAFTHHEHVNGEGYPDGLKGHEIPFFSKIVAVIDAFDAISSERSYSPSRTTLEALRILYDCRGKQFDEEVVQAFIRMMGIYPPGHIVELSNGEAGIVISCSPKNKLKPKVLVVRNAKKLLCKEKVIDLRNDLVDEAGNSIRVRDLYQDGVFGIQLKEYRDKGLNFMPVN